MSLLRSRRLSSFQWDTIFAVASQDGRMDSHSFRPCSLAVVRISGSRTRQIISQLAPTLKDDVHLQPRKAILAKLYSSLGPASKKRDLLDQGLVIWFPKPHSYTGEDVAELHLHGSRAVLRAISEELSHMEGVRHAEAGEFTRRALMNDKMDLTQVESVRDLIHSESDTQRQVSLAGLEGGLASVYGAWRKSIIRLAAHIEASIDFGEEEFLSPDTIAAVIRDLTQVITQIEKHLARSRLMRGDLIRHGVRIAILGEPNVGKSSLLNAICGRTAAIVSPISGTTRDVIETHLHLAGYHVIIADTAGLKSRNASDNSLVSEHDEIERTGIERALHWATTAHLILYVFDATRFSGLSTDEIKDPIDWAHPSFGDILKSDKSVLWVFNKKDLLQEDEHQRMETFLKELSVAAVSSSAKLGLENLLEVIAARVEDIAGSPSNMTDGQELFLTERHTAHLKKAVAYLSQSLDCLVSDGDSKDLVVAAHYLRFATKEIGYITGHVRLDEILDVVFKDFCIGK